VTLDDRIAQARQRVTRADDELTTLLLAQLAERIHAAYPAAAVVHATGEHNEDLLVSLHADRVTDAAGVTLAGYGNPQTHTDAWDTLTQAIDPLLDEIAQLNGDDYLGAQQLDLNASSADLPAWAHTPSLQPGQVLEILDHGHRVVLADGTLSPANRADPPVTVVAGLGDVVHLNGHGYLLIEQDTDLTEDGSCTPVHPTLTPLRLSD
jgi:hypothetical protein